MHQNIGTLVSSLKGARAPVLVAVVTACLICASPVLGREGGEPDVEEPPEASGYGLPLERILSGYNENVERTYAAIDSLRVVQHMYDPQPDGTRKSAEAVLTYTPASGMTREEICSEIDYPAGDYTLRSLVGPTLVPSEYAIGLEGTEQSEGYECYRLSLEAIVRDVDHIDGTIWISVRHLTPVRIVAEVSDPPFPITEIQLDKAFAPEPSGLWFVRRHSGEGEASLLLTRMRGVRHIFYDDYVVTHSDVPNPEPVE